MRRITAVGLSALALCGVIGTTAGTASASTTGGQKYGVLAGTSSRTAAPTPIGKKHSFHYSIPGSDISGVWYSAMRGGTKDIWLKFAVRHTRADGNQAAICVKIVGQTAIPCLTTGTAKGATNSASGWAGPWKHISVKAALGHVTGNTFYTSKSGSWHKLF